MEDPSLRLDHCCPVERMVAMLANWSLKCLINPTSANARLRQRIYRGAYLPDWRE